MYTLDGSFSVAPRIPRATGSVNAGPSSAITPSAAAHLHSCVHLIFSRTHACLSAEL